MKTVREISVKLGTLIKHACIRIITLAFISLELFPFDYFFHTIPCPLYNLKTIRNISMKHGTLIKHDEMMCHAKEP